MACWSPHSAATNFSLNQKAQAMKRRPAKVGDRNAIANTPEPRSPE